MITHFIYLAVSDTLIFCILIFTEFLAVFQNIVTYIFKIANSFLKKIWKKSGDYWVPKITQKSKIWVKIDATASQKIFFKKSLWAEFLTDIQNLYTKLFKIINIKIKKMFKILKGRLGGPKFTENYKFEKNDTKILSYSSFFNPITTLTKMFNIFFENYHIFLKFWYHNFENQIKIDFCRFNFLINQ